MKWCPSVTEQSEGPMDTVASIISLPRSGPVPRSDACPLGMQSFASSILGSGNILSWRLVMKSFLRPFSPYPSRAAVSYWRKDVHLELANRLESLPRNTVVSLTDSLDDQSC